MFSAARWAAAPRASAALIDAFHSSISLSDIAKPCDPAEPDMSDQQIEGIDATAKGNAAIETYYKNNHRDPRAGAIDESFGM